MSNLSRDRRNIRLPSSTVMSVDLCCSLGAKGCFSDRKNHLMRPGFLHSSTVQPEVVKRSQSIQRRRAFEANQFDHRNLLGIRISAASPTDDR